MPTSKKEKSQQQRRKNDASSSSSGPPFRVDVMSDVTMEELKVLTAKVTKERDLNVCPICFEDFTPSNGKSVYQQLTVNNCCGKQICLNCSLKDTLNSLNNPRTEKDHLDESSNVVQPTCPFCRCKVPSTPEDAFRHVLQLAEKKNSSWALFQTGQTYVKGRQDNQLRIIEIDQQKGM